MEDERTLAGSVPAGASAYLLTVAPDGRAHAAPASVSVRDASAVVASRPGRRTLAHVAAGSAVTVLWSPAHGDDHSLIVDGTGLVQDGALVVRPTRAVLHRQPVEGAAATGAPAGACAADCIEIALP